MRLLALIFVLDILIPAVIAAVTHALQQRSRQAGTGVTGAGESGRNWPGLAWATEAKAGGRSRREDAGRQHRAPCRKNRQ